MPHPWNLPAWEALTADLAHLPHALLLHGPRGTGKKAFALALAQRLLCTSPTPLGACGRCVACGWFEQGTHPDFRLLEPVADNEDEAEKSGKKGGKQIKTNAIRELGEFIALASHQGGWRVVIIHPAEAMHVAAANALLKTLEEPPASVLLVLVAHQPGRLLPTVLSRTRKLALPLPGRAAAESWLRLNAGEAAVEVLDEVGGAPLLALEYADPERLERRRRFLAGLAEAEDDLALSGLAQEFQQRQEEAWGWLSRWLYDLLAVQASGQARYFPGFTPALTRLAGRADGRVLWALQRELLDAARWLRHPLNGQLLLESWLLRYGESSEIRHG